MNLNDFIYFFTISMYTFLIMNPTASKLKNIVTISVYRLNLL